MIELSPEEYQSVLIAFNHQPAFNKNNRTFKELLCYKKQKIFFSQCKIDKFVDLSDKNVYLALQF